MADSSIETTSTGGTAVDTRTEGTNGNHRQVMVIGDPATNAGVAPVDGTAGLKVDLGADNDVTVTGSVTANAGTNLNTSALALETGGNLAAVAASASVLDDWDESDRAKVNPIVGQAGVAAGAGAVSATVQRTTLASDDPAVTALQIIDDWDETDRAKVNIIAGQAGITAGAGAVAANTPRVTHASDDPVTTAVQLIDDAIVADDAAFTPATTKVMMAGFEFDDTTPDSVNEGDAGAARMSANRNIYMTIRDAAGNERGANVNASGQLSVVSAAAGDIAHDAVDSGNPIKVGGKAYTSVPTPVADADRVNAFFDEYGRLGIHDRDVEIGLSSGMTGLRENLSASRLTVLADSLADGVASFWTQATAGGGGVASTGGEGRLTTSTGTTGSAQITSPNVPYLPGYVAWMNSAVRFGDTGTSGNIRRIGMFTVSGTTPQDGFYYELTGTTLNAVVVKAGSASATASGSWSKNSTAPFTLDTNYHSFEIRYTANTAWFYIDNVLRHQVSGTSASQTASLSLPITVTNVKTSGASDITFAIRNIGNGRFGPNGTFDGKLITQPYAAPENFVSGAITSAMTGTTSTSLVAAPGAGLRNYITTIVCSNAHATVGTDIAIQDGSGGTTLMTIPAAAVYGGSVITLPVPLRQPTANTAIFCANVTTGASTKVSAVGYKGI